MIKTEKLLKDIVAVVHGFSDYKIETGDGSIQGDGYNGISIRKNLKRL